MNNNVRRFIRLTLAVLLIVLCIPYFFRDLFKWDKTREKAHNRFVENQRKMMHVLIRNLNNDYENTAEKVMIAENSS